MIPPVMFLSTCGSKNISCKKTSLHNGWCLSGLLRMPRAPSPLSTLLTSHTSNASLASLSSSPPSRSTTQGISSSPASSSSPLLQLLLLSFLVLRLGLRTIGHVRPFPDLALLPDLVPVPRVDVISGHRPSSFSFSSFPIHLFLPFPSFFGSSLLRSPALLL